MKLRSFHFLAAATVAASLVCALCRGALAADTAILQGLDKITARISTIRAPVGQPVRFGMLEITARACDKRPPEEPPESAAYMEIRELRPGEAPARVFAGWMFASSPALSALEHPVYDVSVVDCQ